MLCNRLTWMSVGKLACHSKSIRGPAHTSTTHAMVGSCPAATPQLKATASFAAAARHLRPVIHAVMPSVHLPSSNATAREWDNNKSRTKATSSNPNTDMDQLSPQVQHDS
jgi:hypothetical protein